MHEWNEFLTQVATLPLAEGTGVHDATRMLYCLPRGVTFACTHTFTAWRQEGSEFVAELLLDRNQYDVVTNFTLGDGVRATVVTQNQGHILAEFELTPQLVLLLVSAVFTHFTVKVYTQLHPVEPVQLKFDASLYDAATRQKLAMQVWKTNTHKYELGTAQLLKK